MGIVQAYITGIMERVANGEDPETVTEEGCTMNFSRKKNMDIQEMLDRIAEGETAEDVLSEVAVQNVRKRVQIEYATNPPGKRATKWTHWMPEKEADTYIAAIRKRNKVGDTLERVKRVEVYKGRGVNTRGVR